jgi:glutathione S-transferase
MDVNRFDSTLENFPGFMILLVTSSISYPFYASLLGLIYLTGRVVYMLGYSKGDPKKRIRGAFQYIGLIGKFNCNSDI